MRKIAQTRIGKFDPTQKLNRLRNQKVVCRPLGLLEPFPGNARRHPKAQIHALAKNMGRFGFTQPMLIDEQGMILCGHGRFEAAKIAGFQSVPTLTISGLTNAEKRAFVIADNRIAEQAVWDLEVLRGQLIEIVASDVDVELTGYTTGEADLMIDGYGASAERTDPDDQFSDLMHEGSVTSRPDDLWLLEEHRLLCGNALSPTSYNALLGDDRAQMVVTDPPYNVRIQGHAMGRGRVKHREFLMASGEMTSQQYVDFLRAGFTHLARFSRDGSIHYVFIDWRHLRDVLSAGDHVYSEQKNLLVWNKSNAGQGSFYRSKHELIVVYKNGAGDAINNFGLGGKGRYRTNVLDYPSVNSLLGARRGDLELHPTVKPIALIADLIRDCSKRNGLVLDPFGGSGTALLAAERTSRRAAVMELDPRYVDVAIRRFERATGTKASLAGSNKTFAEIESERGTDHGGQPSSGRTHRARSNSAVRRAT